VRESNAVFLTLLVGWSFIALYLTEYCIFLLFRPSTPHLLQIGIVCVRDREQEEKTGRLGGKISWTFFLPHYIVI
jgi:hypothetical protein